ncbi:MAG: efflux RND transporter periplasmic adaptor subunit [Phycisphaerae bacterium]|nr:efflux RND transporter periplasmic adaptor subunit [Phycisphaerae bacterium]
MTANNRDAERPRSWPIGMLYSVRRNQLVVSLALMILLATAFMVGRCSSTDGASHAGGEAVADGSKPTIWTCSMHPNVRLPQFGQCPICFMDLVPVTSDDGDASAARMSLSERARVLARVETTAAEARELTHEIRLVGKVALDETRATYLSSYVAGRIDRLFVDYTGILVRKGDHLAELYSPELLVAQREYLLALARVRQAGGRDRMSPAGGADELPAGPRPADTVLEAARRKLELWGIPSDEIQRLERDGKASDHMRIDAPVTGWVLEKLGYQGMYVETGTRLFTVVDVTRVWVMLDAYESDVQYLRHGQMVEFEAEAFAGRSMKEPISFIDPVLTDSTRTVRVRVNVSNDDMSLRPGMFVRAKVHVELGEGGNVLGNELAGKYVCPMHLEVVRDGPGKCDQCGMALVLAESLGYAASQAGSVKVLSIPVTSVLHTGERAVVYVEHDTEDGPIFEGREVQLGMRAGDWYLVLAGLNEGERVVTRGALQIDSAMQIHAKPSMMQAGNRSSGGDSMGRGASTTALSKAVVSRAVAGAAYHAVAAPVIDGYLELVKSLAADDVARARAALSAISGSAEKAWKSVGTDNESTGALGLPPADAARFSELMKAIGEAATLDADSGIAAIRERLPQVNEPIELYLRTFGHSRATPIYRAFCPMAFDDKGAQWFQADTTINNAYFGSRMLRCGVIQGEIGGDGREKRQ